MANQAQAGELAVEPQPDRLAAALEYAAQGIAVFPLHTPSSDGSCSCRNADCGSVGKHPRTPNGVKDATTDAEQIRRWWTQWPEANIGIATGAGSDLVVIDVDGDEGEESLRRLTARHGPLPATRTAKTGRGRHLYFKHPGGKVKSKAPMSRDCPHVDSRGDGGYVVAPPSLHVSGARYVADETMPMELAAAPTWLVAAINGAEPTRSDREHGAANDPIAEGSRNARLTSLAGTMRRGGMLQEAIEAALLATNSEQCAPPLPEEEVRAIARSVSSYAPGASNDVLRTLTDAGNAERFARQWGEDVRWVPELNNWLVWNGTNWQPDRVGRVMEMAKATARAIYLEGQHADSDVRKQIAAHSRSSLQAKKLEAMLKLARTIPELVLPIAQLDADPWLLGVQNGTLDLKLGTLQAARREDYITKVAPVIFDAEAECPEFLRFLSEIMGDDQDLVAYLQRLVGYLLTGDTSEQCLFYLYGTGANGKSTFLNACKGILGGELCRQMPVETIMAGGRK